mgnify:CR=1 FL=1
MQAFGELFGCVLGIKPSVTAITIVALGTSLPDTFASMIAAKQEQLKERLYSEWERNHGAVCSTFKTFIYEYSVAKGETQACEDLHKLLALRYRSGAPRRPPRVVLIGPPGSGRTVQAKLLAKAYDLVHVSPEDLLRSEAERHPGIKLKIKESVEKGDPVPDEIMLRLIDGRLRQSDCRINGWVLDGFPQSERQVNLLNAIGIKPSIAVLFE